MEQEMPSIGLWGNDEYDESVVLQEASDGNDRNNVKKIEGTWTNSMLLYLDDICTKSVSYRDIHEQSAIYCENRYNLFSFLLIFLSFMTTCVSGIPFDDLICNSYYKLVLAVLSFMTTTLATISKFLNYQAYAARHRIGSQKFLELNQTITEELIKPQFKNTNGKNFVKWASATFRSIRKGLPYPPRKIQLKYDIIEPETNVKHFIREAGGTDHIINVTERKENESEFNWELRRFKFNT